jgi:D-alanyl-D-alanine carboxypeptidase/D-alanyl-D-alanine-endopeptidase (penicillin-binding protein 4)
VSKHAHQDPLSHQLAAGAPWVIQRGQRRAVSSSKRPVIALLILLLLATGGVSLGAQPAPELSTEPAAVALRARLTRLFAKTPKTTAIGLVVAECDTGETWVAQQPRRPLKPASVAKLFTTAAALAHLGPDFTYETRLYVQDGELLVLGGGDPGLGDGRIALRHGQPLHGEFDEWARLLKERGVSSLRTIALDDTIFDRQYRHPDWPDRQAAAWYQAPVGGINFNDNCLDARVTVSGGSVTLILTPELPDDFFRNELKAGAEHEPVATRAVDQDVFEFRGPVARDDQFKPISVGQPAVFFGHALQHALEQRGIALQGQTVRRTMTPALLAEAELLDVRSTSLKDVLWRCNTFSQNLFAECVLKSLAAYGTDGSRSGTEGSWAGGVRVLEATLQKLGINLEGAVFRDGSGLSHENRVTAEQTVQLLVAMRRHPSAEVYADSLAQPGQDGTLRHRRWDTPSLHNRLRAKTGTIDGVRSLAGYISRTDGRTLAFAMLVNGDSTVVLGLRLAEALAEAGIDPRP